MPRGRLKKCYSCFLSGKKCHREHLIKIPTARPLLESLLYREFFIEQVEQSDDYIHLFNQYHAGEINLVDLLDAIEDRRFQQPLWGKRGIRIIAHRKRPRIAIEMYGVKHIDLNDTQS